MLDKIKSLLGIVIRDENPFSEAEKFSIYAPFFTFAIVGASSGKLSAFKWIGKEPQFSACYMIGFSFVLADSTSTNDQGLFSQNKEMFALNIAFQIFKQLLFLDDTDLDEDSKRKISVAYFEYLFKVDVKNDPQAFEMGISDAQTHLIKKTNLPRSLTSHIQNSY